MIIAISLGLVGVVAIAYSIAIYNNLVAVKNDVDRAWSNIDVLLKQRHDELPKLLKLVETYMQYEQDTLSRIIEARSRYATATRPAEQMKADSELHKGLMGLFALAENYPELKANSQFQELQRRISQIESSISDRREFYNASANSWNTTIEQVPEVVYSKILMFKPKDLFEANPYEREDVPVNIRTPRAS